MYVRSPIYRKIKDVIQSCKINAVATFLGGMLRNVTVIRMMSYHHITLFCLHYLILGLVLVFSGVSSRQAQDKPNTSDSARFN